MANDNWLPSLWGNQPGDPFAVLRRQIDDLFADVTGGAKKAGLPALPQFSPNIDIVETDAELKLVADLPGLSEKEVEVTLAGRTLTVKGERRTESEDKKDEKGRVYHRIERSYGMFRRTLELPFEPDQGKVEATFKNGVLTVRVPKPAEARNATRRIPVTPAA